ncbi:MAG: molecular chaperone HtpG [Clostridia bacterium]|nr:molecular chaperone HtpG [Clostridia bacterium]
MSENTNANTENMNEKEETGSEVKRGGISVEAEHIFPIIKKWLYSDKDIFIREIVSNASDAVTKLRRLDSLGEISLPEGEAAKFRVDVELDAEAGTVSVTDNGIGMTREELEKYICSIALSGALDFIRKYESSGGDASDKAAGSGIIGHFGLGFYSSFMVSDTVEIDTLSYTGGEAVHWTCTEAGDYEITRSDREERGTTVTMHISSTEKDYLRSEKLLEVLKKYCSFMPVPVYFDSGEDGTATGEGKDAAADGTGKKEPQPINDTLPLWAKPQSEITDEEYNEFYHKLFSDIDDPLFHIHINADYPLNFKGILYFPKIRTETQSLEGHVKLFYNQVFVADNIKEVLPDYLLMLRGALDCPELPLNVSRSYLQDSAYVKRIAQFIVKKVADKLNSLAKNDREKYEKVYSDIRIFIEYACLREKKFYDRVSDSLLLRLTDGRYRTFDEYLENADRKNEKSPAEGAETSDGDASGNEEEKGPEEKKETDGGDGKKPEGTVYYATDTALQTQYISMLTGAGKEVAVFDLLLDSQYITAIEQYREGISFRRVDADISDAVKDGSGEKNKDGKNEVPKALARLMRKVSGNEKLEVAAEPLVDAAVPAVLTVSEQSRRFEDMMRLYAAPGEEYVPPVPSDMKLTLNTRCGAYAKLVRLAGEGDGASGDSDGGKDAGSGEKTEQAAAPEDEAAERYASFVYRLALLAQKKLTAGELSAFLSDSYRLLELFD